MAWTERYDFYMIHDTRKSSREFIKEFKKFIRKFDNDVKETDLNKGIKNLGKNGGINE